MHLGIGTATPRARSEDGFDQPISYRTAALRRDPVMSYGSSRTSNPAYLREAVQITPHALIRGGTSPFAGEGFVYVCAMTFDFLIVLDYDCMIV